MMLQSFIGAQFHDPSIETGQRKQERFIKREEEKARQEAEEAARIQREQEEQDALPLPPVDPETGEILSEVPDYDFPPIPEEEWIEPEIILPQTDFDVPDVEEDFEDEEVQVDFSAKEALEYKLPSLQLFAPDKPKESVQGKEDCSRKYQNPRRNLCQLWYQGDGGTG